MNRIGKGKLVRTLIDLLKSSVLTQWTITVVILGVYAGLLFSDKPIPALVENLVILCVSFYFGSKLGVIQGQYQEQQKTKQEEK